MSEETDSVPGTVSDQLTTSAHWNAPVDRRVSVADLARYRFELHEHGALAAIEGVFPMRPRHSILEGT